MTPATSPLARHGLFRSHDRDDARARIGAVFCPHDLDQRQGDQLAVVHNRVAMGDVSLNYLTYGGNVTIRPVAFEHFYLIQLPIAGQAELRWGDGTMIADATRGSITNPSDTVDMHWTGDCGKIILRIDRGAVERYAATLLGRPLGDEVRFNHAIDAATPAGARFLRMIHFLVDEMEASTGALGPLAAKQFEQLLIAQLMDGQDHSLSTQLQCRTAAAVPRHVRRAEDFIDAHAHEPIGCEDIADAAGVSLRALHDAFRRFRETTPLEHLRAVRMQRARADLLAATRHETVSDIACRWGFSQFGRFAGRYRQMFGETPSTTLKRAVNR